MFSLPMLQLFNFSLYREVITLIFATRYTSIFLQMLEDSCSP